MQFYIRISVVIIQDVNPPHHIHFDPIVFPVTENAGQHKEYAGWHTFKAPCLVALNMHLTLNLLLYFVVKTINVRLD